LIVLEADLEIIRQVIAELGITIEKIITVPKKDWHYRSC
jgi:hypothetical protein